MVTVTVNVAKIVLMAGVAIGIIILANKVDGEGSKEVLGKAFGSHDRGFSGEPEVINS